MGKHLDRDDVALALAYKFIPKSKLKKKLFLKDVQLAIQKRRKMENPRAKKPSISALSRLYKGGTHKAKRPDKRRTKKRKDPRGRPSKTTPKERRNLITVLNRKEKENKGRDITAPYLLKNWEHEKEMSPATVSRILRKSGRPWRRSKKKIQLTPEAKAKRKAWAAYWRRRAKDFWQKHVLVTDEKTFRFHRTPKAKKVALTFKKTGSYCKAGEQAIRASASRHKHRQGYVPVKVSVTVGAGKIRSVTFYKGEMTKEKYCDFLHDIWLGDMLAVARDSRISPGAVYFMRDNDPKSRDRVAEDDAIGARRVIRQEPDSPDTNALDYSLWDKVENDMHEEELVWLEAHPGRDWVETQEFFEARLEMHLLSLEASYIRKTMGSMKRRCRQFFALDGALVPDD